MTEPPSAMPPTATGGIAPHAAARRLGVHTVTLLRWARRGLLPTYRASEGRLYIPEDAVRRLEKENPRMAKNYDESDPDNRPLNREERRALREQDRRFAELRRIRERAQKPQAQERSNERRS